MADRVCTNFIDDDGLDIGCHLVSKEYVLEAYPELVPWMKTPALWGWGNNYNNQLGTNDSNLILRSSPVQTISAGTNWKQVSAGQLHTAAIKTDGTLWIWGRNSYGGLGTNTNITGASSPVQTVSAGTNWKSVRVAIASAAIKTDGTLWLWGDNSAGSLGTGNLINRSSPVQTISAGTNWKSVSIQAATAAIKTDGTLWLWGGNNNGLLGNSSINNTSSPVQTVSAGTNWKSVSTSGVTAAIKTDGTLWLWGSGYFGTLGNNVGAYGSGRSSPVQTVSGGTNWKSVSASPTHTAAIKTDGTLWIWGRNNTGQLGTNDLIQRSSPVQTVSGGTNWFKVTTYTNITSAIKTDGSLWLWGNGYYGAFADNTTTSKSSPVQIMSSKTSWSDIAVYTAVFGINDEGEF